MRIAAISLQLPILRPLTLGLILLGIFCAWTPKHSAVFGQATQPATAPPAQASPPAPPGPAQAGPGDISEDEMDRGKKKVEDSVTEASHAVDGVISSKEKEILTV